MAIVTNYGSVEPGSISSGSGSQAVLSSPERTNPVGFFDYLKQAFQEQGDRMTNYASSTALVPHIDNNSKALYNSASGETRAKIDDILNTIAPTSGNSPDTQESISDILGTQSNSAGSFDEINNKFLDLYSKTGDSSYMEKYLDNLVEQYNTASARQYETEMSNTAYQRAFKDIKDAGYNPWLLLQGNASGSSTPNVASAKTSDINASSVYTSRQNQIAQNSTELLGKILTAVGIGFAVLVRALV